MSDARLWQSQYPPGVPLVIEPPEHASLADRILSACRRHLNRVAASCGGERLLYSDLERQSAALSAWLASAGFGKGQRIALMLPNVLAQPVAMLAAHRLGMVVVNVNPLYTARELRHQLNDSGAVALVIAQSALPVFAEVAAEVAVNTCVVVASPGDDVPRDWPHAGCRLTTFEATLRCDATVPNVSVGHDDLAFLQYTGGTTGVSKGAMLSHGNVLSNLAQVERWIAPLTEARLAVITALPLYHIFALTVNSLLYLGRGAELVLVTNPRDVDALVATLRAHPPGFITGVNTLFNALVSHPEIGTVDFSQLHMAMGGGTAILAPTSRRWQALTGAPIVQGYGLSEASPILTVCSPDEEFSGSIGYPVPSTDIEIRDPETGEALPVGEQGELCARGPQIMRGYWRREDQNDRTFHPGGWLRTGDVARMDPRGALFVVDRTKDMILVSGFNVYPNEVESVCSEHPDIVESACIGVQDERTGEAVKVFVVRRNEALSAEQVIEHCRRFLTPYKVPRQVDFLAQLPKSPVGKILRRELRTAATAT